MYLVLTICVILSLVLIIVLLIEIQKIRKKRQVSINYNHYLADMPDPKTQQKLLEMVDGDIYTVKKLISKIKQKYPHKTELWYWEKAIRDLESERY